MGTIQSTRRLNKSETVLYRYLKITSKALAGLEAFGTNFECIDKRNNKKYILKRTTLQDGDAGPIIKEKMSRATHEVEILKKLSDHINIVTLFDVVLDGTSLCLIFDHCEVGNLNDILVQGKKLTGRKIRKFFHDIYDGVAYIHSHHMTHNNLKPESILITSNGRCKLTHLGLATYCNLTTLVQYKSLVLECYGNRRGVRFFWSPEMMGEVYERTEERFEFRSDIFSLGLIRLVLWASASCIVYLDDMYDPPHRAIVPHVNGKPFCECHQWDIDHAVRCCGAPGDVIRDIKNMLKVPRLDRQNSLSLPPRETTSLFDN